MFLFKEFIASIESQAIESLLSQEDEETRLEVEDEDERPLTEDVEAVREEEEARKRYAEARRLLANPAQARLADSVPVPTTTTTVTTTARTIATASTTEASIEEINRQYKPVKAAQRVRLLSIKSAKRPTSTEAPAATDAPPAVAVEEEFVWPTTYRPVEAVPGRSAKPASSAKVAPSPPGKQQEYQPQAARPTNSFFVRPDPPNAVRVGGGSSVSPSIHPAGNAVPVFGRPGATATVRIDNIEVPRNSKMTKNLGLRLLQNDIPVIAERNKLSGFGDVELEPAPVLIEEDDTPAKKEASVDASVASASAESDITAAIPVVHGFRIKGDRTNRIVFLNLADLGMEHAHSRTLRIGANELIPVDGLVSSIEGIPKTFLSTNTESTGTVIS